MYYLNNMDFTIKSSRIVWPPVLDHPQILEDNPNKSAFTIYDLKHSLLEHEVSEALGKLYRSDVEIQPHDNNVDGCRRLPVYSGTAPSLARW